MMKFDYWLLIVAYKLRIYLKKDIEFFYLKRDILFLNNSLYYI